jgi:ribosomal protein S6--L-glutamate ligase
LKLGIVSKNKELYTTERLLSKTEEQGQVGIVIDPTLCVMTFGSDSRLFLMPGGNDLGELGAVIPRLGVTSLEEGISVVRQFESIGVPVQNSSVAIEVAKNKLKTIQILSKKGLPVPPTFYLTQYEQIPKAIELCGEPPLVVKTVLGTKGIGVILAETRRSLYSVVETLCGMGEKVLIQRFLDEAGGRDKRLIVLGDRVVAAMERRAKRDDFRSNIHRGGEGEGLKATGEEERIAVEAARAVGLRLAGIDIMDGGGGKFVIDVNVSPGLEGIERATGVDVAGAIVRDASSLANKERRSK